MEIKTKGWSLDHAAASLMDKFIKMVPKVVESGPAEKKAEIETL